MTNTPAPDASPRTGAPDEEWASLASELAATKGARTTPTDAAAEPPRGVQRAVFASSVALLFAFLAVMVAGMLWWQYRQFYVSLDETDAAAAEALARVRAEQRALQDSLEDVDDDVATLRQSSTSLGERLDALPGRFMELEERLDTVQGGSFDARGDLLRSEAEYYLAVANTELTLTRDFATAVTALELADGRLAELGNPELAPVRDAIAGELLALRSLRLSDIEGIVFGLGRLAARADELPLRAELAAEPRRGSRCCARRRARHRAAVARDQEHSARSRARRAARRPGSASAIGGRACARAPPASRSSSSSPASRRCAPTSKLS